MQRANLKQFADVLLVCKVCREPFENSSALLDHVDKMHLQLPVQVPGSSPMRVLKTYTRNKKPLEVIESTTSLNMSKSKTETVPPAQLQSTPTGGTSVFKQPLVSLLRIQTPSDQVPTAAAQATGASSSLSQVVPSTDLKCIPTAVPPARNLLFQAEIENKALLNAVDSDDISEEGKTEVNLVEEHDDSKMKASKKLYIQWYKVKETATADAQKVSDQCEWNHTSKASTSTLHTSAVSTYAPGELSANIVKLEEGTSPGQCEFCPTAYLSSQEEVDMHKKCHVAGHSYLKCPHCYKITTAWAHMARHLASHTGENITMARKGKVRDKRCEKCDKQFSSSALLNLHQQRVHDDVHRFVCHECGDRFKYEKAYKRHLDLHNNVIYQCEHCKYQSKVRANIRSHMKVHEGRGQICDVCGKVFSMPSRLKKHMELHNRTADSNVVCVYCSKVYSSKATLDIHFKREHSTVCSVQCQFCDYIGKDNSYLQEHLKKKHFKEFTCNNCPYATFNEETLRRHMDTHREFRPYSCTLCYYKAREQKTLLSHMRNKHSQNESARKHVCPFCGMKFKSSSMLKAHMPTHTGDKPHHCLFCDYSAKHRATLYRHNLSKHRSLVAITLSQKQSREFYNGGGGVAAGSCDERAGEEQTTYEDGLHVLADQIEVVDYQVAATTVADNDNSARLSLRSDDDDDAAAPPAGVVVNGADVRIDEATLHHIMEATPNGGTLIIQTDGSF